ncbi:hypothetical protein IH86_14285 [Sphingobium yanoikuyae]|uniref:Uncharacterized protein n=1 Tax=Sphingobium yanoikuyae TaxID=13690 RepID=A0A085K4A1_SPHYA|nr:hypothetical protein [Sphingobium yanoikuyae]AYO80704.1 hypothetical protein EBF16_20135 [Sphingobium yanoikuyae]KFD27547.1 hypothetical protein IH86_14285 [Sphingobium yanoikuyae]MDV3480737.1 hypothetical protein [Sphingobium yanoikuyae]
MQFSPLMHFVEARPTPLPHLAIFADAEELQRSDDNISSRALTGQYVAMGGAILLTALLFARGLR